VCGDKLKKEWRKGRKGEGKTENLGSRQKRKGWFSRWRGEVDAQALLRYTRNRSIREALENELNKQGLGGSGQNALEKMKEIENKY
jgi:hypothetical protein